MSPAVSDALGRTVVARRLVISVLAVYFGVLGVYTVIGAADGDFALVSWIGVGVAYACYAAAATLLSVTIVVGMSDAQARWVAALTVCAVAATWTAAAAAHTGVLGDYQPMLSSSTVIAVILLLRGRVLLAWIMVVTNVTVGVILGPLTTSPSWINVVLPRASLTILFIATCGAVFLGPQIVAMRALGNRESGRHGRRPGPVRRDERIRRIEERVRPLLQQVAEGEELTDDDVAFARLLEARLRDGIRGRALDVPVVREAVWGARARGVAVTLLDDGGLDELPSERAASVVEAVAENVAGELAGRASGGLVARIAPPGRDPVATVTVVSEDVRYRTEFGADGFVLRTVQT